MTQIKRGAAFSGGGFFGNVTVGMLDRIREEEGFEPWDAITGISTGALIGSLLAMRPRAQFAAAVQQVIDVYTPRVTEDIHRAWWFGKIAALWKPSLRSSRPLGRLIDELIDVDAIREGHYEMGVGILNLDRGGYEFVMPDYVPFARAVEASASLPAFFEPVALPQKGLSVDGGAVLGCDIGSLVKMGCDEIDAFVTFPEQLDPKPMLGKKALGVALRTFESMVQSATWRQIQMTRAYNHLAKANPESGKRYIKLRVWAPDTTIGDSMVFRPDQAVELQALGREIATRILAES